MRDLDREILDRLDKLESRPRMGMTGPMGPPGEPGYVPKPIFVIRLHKHTREDHLSELKIRLAETLVDYHTLILRDEFNEGDTIFEMYNPKNITDIDMVRLRQIVDGCIDEKEDLVIQRHRDMISMRGDMGMDSDGLDI